MKRVLNSGSISLPYVKGSEKERLDTIYSLGLFGEEAIQFIIEENPMVLNHVKFTFEIKAPQLMFQIFQNAHLGTFKPVEGSEHQVAYLPPAFYKLDPSGFIPMDAKSCNDHNTKLNNYYNWAFNFYNKLIKEGVCKEQARLVLPQGIFTTFLWEINAKDLIAFVDKNSHGSPELFGYCSTLVLYLEDHLPNVTAYLKRNQWKSLV